MEKVFLRIFGLIETEVGLAGLAGNIGQGGHLRNQIITETEPLIDDESPARQEQGDATGQHNDRGKLAFDRAGGKEGHGEAKCGVSSVEWSGCRAIRTISSWFA